MATFNAAPFVEAALRSALAQGAGHIEVVVVDDCSSDATPDLVAAIAKADPRVRLIRSAQNGGPARARNQAIEQARGRWLAVLDCDDLWHPERLSRLIAAAEECQVDAIADNLVIFDDAVEGGVHFLMPGDQGFDLALDRYLRKTLMYGRGVPLGYLKPIFRLDRLRAARLRYDESLRIGEDDDLIVRMLMAGLRYRFDPFPGYGYRKHSASISHRLSAQNAQAMAGAAERLIEAVPAGVTRGLLAQRCDHLKRALQFARLIDAIKARDWAAAARIGIGARAVLPLLRQPLAAALRRQFPRAEPSDPAAERALAAIMGHSR